MTNYIIELLDANTGTDQLKMSAVGMARTWVNRREPIPDSNKETAGYTGRDELARALVRAMEGNPSTDEVYVDLLTQARAHLNAPYVDRSKQAKRSPLIKPKDKKKADAAR